MQKNERSSLSGNYKTTCHCYNPNSKYCGFFVIPKTLDYPRAQKNPFGINFCPSFSNSTSQSSHIQELLGSLRASFMLFLQLKRSPPSWDFSVMLTDLMRTFELLATCSLYLFSMKPAFLIVIT